MVIDIDMVFRGKDSDEGLIPVMHGRTESLDHQDRFAGSELPVPGRNPVDLCILDRRRIVGYGRILVGCLNCGLGRAGSTRAPRCKDKAYDKGE